MRAHVRRRIIVSVLSIAVFLSLFSGVSVSASAAAPDPALEALKAAAAVTALPKAPVYITKNPTTENIYEGGTAVFIAYAANAKSVAWYFINWDASTVINVSDVPFYFPGVTVSGQGGSTLSISNVPAAMSRCRVAAVFQGEGGPVYSDFAYINVQARSSYCSYVCPYCGSYPCCCWQTWQWSNPYYWPVCFQNGYVPGWGGFDPYGFFALSYSPSPGPGWPGGPGGPGGPGAPGWPGGPGGPDIIILSP